MTRKDYIKLAAAIAASCDKSQKLYIDNAMPLLMAQEIAHQIGNVLASDNPNFDWARWMNACNTGA